MLVVATRNSCNDSSSSLFILRCIRRSANTNSELLELKLHFETVTHMWMCTKCVCVCLCEFATVQCAHNIISENETIRVLELLVNSFQWLHRDKMWFWLAHRNAAPKASLKYGKAVEHHRLFSISFLSCFILIIANFSLNSSNYSISP